MISLKHSISAQAATTSETMMAKADRDEAERLNSKNSVEEYIYEIRFSFGTLLKSWSALLHIEAVENLNPLSQGQDLR